MPTNLHPKEARTDGFTIFEVMFAMFILLAGVLAMLSFVESSYTSARKSAVREQGTNLAREVVERARQLPYASTATSVAAAQVRATMPDAGALSGTSFVVRRRNVDYTVTITACSIDDPSDGVGYGDATFCAVPGTTSGAGASPTRTAAGVNVLGIAVTAGGSLLDTVCNAVGTNSAVISRLTGAVSSVASVSACTSTSGTAPFDSRPDDLRRIQVAVSWTTPASTATQTLTQTTLLTNPLPNDCPTSLSQVTTTTPLPAGCPTPIS